MRFPHLIKIVCTSLLFGVLVACSPLQTPIPLSTSTVIPSTATITPTPLTPSPIPVATSTPIILSTVPAQNISTILETDLELDADLTQDIIRDLAEFLDISANRIRLVTVEAIGSRDNAICDELVDEGLVYLLLIGDTLYEYQVDDGNNFERCDKQAIIADDILVAVDPLAAETFRVVQNLVATELDLSTRRVQLVEMMPVIWTDTSLGCPQDEQTYTDVEIAGYHIVVSVADENYIYHSDSNTVYPCAADDVVLPEN